MRQLLDVKTMALNVRDAFRVLWGLGQSKRLLKRLKPNCVFIKGGFVGVPVGIAAAKLHIPYITHDSDAIPGLANRLIAKKAAVHAVALPAEVYKYPREKTVTVGVPVARNFQLVDAQAVSDFRADTGLSQYQQVLFVTGGGLGAERLNKAFARILPDLLKAYSGLAVVQTVGRANEQRVIAEYGQLLTVEELKRVFVKGYTSDLYKYSGAADIVIARAGATNLAELEVQGKACIIVPNPNLTGGHQLKNAQFLAEKDAIILITEEVLQADVSHLRDSIIALLENPMKRAALGVTLHSYARDDAAQRLAVLLLEQGTAPSA